MFVYGIIKRCYMLRINSDDDSTVGCEKNIQQPSHNENDKISKTIIKSSFLRDDLMFSKLSK